MAFLATTLWSCNKDKVDPTLNTFAIEENDLIQVTNSNPNVTVTISAQDDVALDKIEVAITKEGGTTPVAKTSINSIIAKEVGKFKVDVPFPTPDKAPNGLYTIAYSALDKKGKTVTKSYKVNILNNQVVKVCNFVETALPAGKKVWIYLTVEAPMEATDKIYITGSAAGGWSGGGEAQWAFEKVSDKCYKLAADLTSGQQYKLTRGIWDKEATDHVGGVPGNYDYTGQTKLEHTIYNWKDKTTTIFVLPEEVPAGAIKTGMITAIVDVNSTDDSKPYYFVKKGATAVTDANKMLRMAGTKKMAIAVAKEANAEYVVVRDVIENTGVGDFGFEKTFKLDGVTNPAVNSVAGFKNTISPVTELYLTGDGAPANWTNSPPIAQKFTDLGGGKFAINSINLTADKDIKFLPQFGAWNPQIGRATVSADRLTGTVKKANEADTFKTPLTGGDYKIEIDFQTATYKLTKL